jgi:hypothetical protein
MQESIPEGYSLKKQLYPTEVLTADEWGPESHLVLRSVILLSITRAIHMQKSHEPAIQRGRR